MRHRRLRNVGLAAPRHSEPAEVVRALLAVQAQDFAGSKWSIGQRCSGVIDADVERALDAGEILRTHVLRPTWHYVTPEDIRWLLALTAPRVHAASAAMRRKLELDEVTLRRGHAAIARALEGGSFLTRTELGDVLEGAGVAPAVGQRLAYIVMAAELDELICSGPRRGKQFTYALLAERAPHARVLSRSEARAELARRFFTTRGPANEYDLAKWASLTLADARAAVASVERDLARETIGGRVYWGPMEDAPAGDRMPAAHLISIYDEYISSYRGFDDVVADAAYGKRLVGMGAALAYVVLVDGRIVGTWRRTIGKAGVRIEVDQFYPLPKRAIGAIEAAAARFGRFLSLPATIETFNAGHWSALSADTSVQ